MKTLGLSTEDAGKLESRTQGWVLGLKMIALALQRTPNMAGFITSFTDSQRYVMDYLVEEVLQRQTSEVRDFLLETSMLERMTAPLCDGLTGRNDSGNMLKDLERGNLFIAPLDEARAWYRYDHLFLDLLRHQLEMRYGPDHIVELHRRASHWYEQHSFLDEAINHALEAKDWKTATRLLLEQLADRSRKGEWLTLLNWLRQLPEEVRNGDPRLVAIYGHMLVVAGRLDNAAAMADRMEQIAKENSRQVGYVAELRGLIASRRGDKGRAVELWEEALKLIPENDVNSQSRVNLQLGFIYWNNGQFKQAEPLLTKAYEAGRKAGSNYVASDSLALLAAAESSSAGKMRTEVDRYRLAIELAGPNPAACSSHQSLGWTLYEMNDLDGAVREIERALELGQLTGMQGFVARQYALLAHCRLAQGDEVGAGAEIEKSRQIAQSTGQPGVRADCVAYGIALALRLNDLATASELGHRLAEDASAMPFYHKHVPLRLLIAQGEKKAAAERLKTLYDEDIRGQLQGMAIKVRVCQALAADTTEFALRFLAEVMAITEPEGYIRTFVDEGRLLAPLLRYAITRGIFPDYASRLLTVIEAEEALKLSAVKEPQPLLSERELEVLRLVAAGLSSREIAGKLNVSLNTTNTHIRHIFEKLDSKSRVQAVAQARELKLIQ